MGVHDRLRARRCPRSEHDADRQHRLGRASREGGRVGTKGGETRLTVIGLVGRRRLAAVVVGHDDPIQVPGIRGDDFRELRLGDRGHAAGVIGEVLDLASYAAGIRRHPDGADLGACVPGQDHLGAVFGVDQDLVALAHAARVEPGGNRGDLLVELLVGPPALLAVLGFPDEDRVIGLGAGPQVQEPWDVLPRELKFLDSISIRHGLRA